VTFIPISCSRVSKAGENCSLLSIYQVFHANDGERNASIFVSAT
jgi:hypothetical protein